LFFSSQLVIFVVDYALKSIDRLLSCLGQFDSLLFVVILLVFLVIDKSSGIVFELTCGQLSLHKEIGCRRTHLGIKIRESCLGNDFFESRL
jgi:phage-related holin